MSPLRVIVTGGGRGIGRAIALRFARERARVIVAARTSSELDKVVAEIDAAGGKGLATQMDLLDHGSIEAAVYRAVDFAEGAIDVLVNNAGIFESKPFADTDLASWERMIGINLTGPYLVTLETLAALREGERPHIFQIASIAARRGFEGSTAYCASKYGLRGFSDALREDLRADGIRVSTVYPGTTATTIFQGVAGNWDQEKMNRPEDVAEVVWKGYQTDAGYEDLEVPPRG